MNTLKTNSADLANKHRLPRQRGVVLLFALIALTIMLIGAVALISSFNTSLVAAGNIGFKRDLTNQAEFAAREVLTQFNATGALADSVARANDKSTQNYSAVILPTNIQGIPTDLLNSAKFSPSVGAPWTKGDVDPNPGLGQKVTIRYLVDRLCTAAGNAQTQLEPEQCIRAPVENVPKGLDQSSLKNRAEFGDIKQGVGSAVAIPATYRITIRAMGPRNTEAYYQMTFTEPLPAPAALPP